MEDVEIRLALSWRALALRGALAVLFGVLAFFWPGLFWLVVVYTFGAYALIDGIMAIVLAVTAHGRVGPWWALLLEGVVGIAVAVLAFAWPGITELAMLYLIAGWCLAIGVLEIVAAIQLWRYLEGVWLLAVSGVLSVILGLGLAIVPGAGLLAVAWWVGAYLVVFGALLLALAFRLRGLTRHARRPEAALVP